jgi:hypothetical protein
MQLIKDERRKKEKAEQKSIANERIELLRQSRTLLQMIDKDEKQDRAAQSVLKT